MQTLLMIFLLCTSLISLSWGSAQASPAKTPPRGWNSYDAFSWIITEDQFLANAQVMADKLKSSGYEYAVVDFLWYRKNVAGASVISPGYDVIDEWGRPVPDPARWPSSAGGKGFGPIADKVHAMGLKFGIHVMRGISTVAVSQNTPILGAHGWRAQDIALTSSPCSWMSQCFVSVNTSSEAGKAFINSLYQQYASWGVDFVKHDCVFGQDDLSVDEITVVSEAIVNTGHPMVYSISPGVRATPSMGNLVQKKTHMYRITSDDWDTWSDLQSHFDVARDFAASGLIGTPTLQGGQSWPDLDMLPLGWLTDPGASHGPYRSSRLTPDEQKTQLTLWAIARSPLIYGGDLRHIDESTLTLITNPIVLDINSNSFGNSEIAIGSSTKNEALPILSLVGCEQYPNTRWAITNAQTNTTNDQLCWIASQSMEQAIPRELSCCLNWTSSSKLSISLDNVRGSQEIKVNGVQKGVPHLWSEDAGSICLDSLQAKYQLRKDPKNITSQLFSSCSGKISQTWQLTSKGELRSTSEPGLCAKVDAQVSTFRIWGARGNNGQYYLAFFNLGMEESIISLSFKIFFLSQNFSSNGGEFSPSRVSARWYCSDIDVWSNQRTGVYIETISVLVPSHGCKLFSLNCDVKQPKQ